MKLLQVTLVHPNDPGTRCAESLYPITRKFLERGIGEIKTGKSRFHALIQFDLHSFDKNITSL